MVLVVTKFENWKGGIVVLVKRDGLPTPQNNEARVEKENFVNLIVQAPKRGMYYFAVSSSHPWGR